MLSNLNKLSQFPMQAGHRLGNSVAISILMEIYVQPNTGCCLSGSVEIFRPFLLCLLLTGVLGTHQGTLSEQEGNDLTPTSRKDAEIYISGKPALPSPMRLWDLEGWGLGRGPNQNMFCLALWYDRSSITLPSLGLVYPSPLPLPRLCDRV